MKINNQNLPGVLGPYVANRGASEAARPSGQSDRLELSARTRELAAARQLMDQLPLVRSQRVDQLRRLIKSGAYQPDARQVADVVLRRKALEPVE